MSAEIIQFFNQISSDYDDLIARTVPRYREMFWAMLYYLPPSFQPKNVLELGCGTGNLTRLLYDRWPDSKITAVDISRDMLQKTVQKLPTATLSLVESAFETLSFSENQFDLVISSIAMHHIQDPEKRQLLKKIYQWLQPQGFFVLGDQVRSASSRLYEADIEFYEAYAQENGASKEDILQWRSHRNTQDHYATLSDLTHWLSESGFSHVDILWRYCFWAVIQGQKA